MIKLNSYPAFAISPHVPALEAMRLSTASIIKDIATTTLLNEDSTHSTEIEHEINVTIENFNNSTARKIQNLPLLENTLHTREKIYLRASEIVKLRNEKKTNADLAKDPDHRLARKIAKGMLAIDLGIGTEDIGRGSNQSLFIKSVSGKIQGVFKPQNPISLKQRLLNLFWQGQRQFLNSGFYAETCAEKAAEIIARKLNDDEISLSPVKITKMLSDRNEGAFLIFSKGSMPDVQKINDKELSDKEKSMMQKFFLFDFLLGNLDRHNQNWLTLLEGDEIKQIIPIDNANILPRFDIGFLNVNAWKSQYAWKYLKIAEMPFTDEIKAFIKENFSVDQINDMIDSINCDPDIIRLYEKEAIDTIKSQWGSKSIRQIADKINVAKNLSDEEIIKKMLLDDDFIKLYPQQMRFLSKESQEGLKNRAQILRQILAKETPTPKALAANNWNAGLIAQNLKDSTSKLLSTESLDDWVILGSL